MSAESNSSRRLALAVLVAITAFSILAAPFMPAQASEEGATLPPGGNAYWFGRAQIIAERYHLGDVFVRQMTQESGFADDVIYGRQVSWAGAEGIAQIMRSYHPTVDPLDPEEALNYAARHMLDLLRIFDGDMTKALAAYNAGAGNVQEAVAMGGAAWRAFLPSETRLYIAMIMLPGESPFLDGWPGIKHWWGRLSEPVQLERIKKRFDRVPGPRPADVLAGQPANAA